MCVTSAQICVLVHTKHHRQHLEHRFRITIQPTAVAATNTSNNNNVSRSAAAITTTIISKKKKVCYSLNERWTSILSEAFSAKPTVQKSVMYNKYTVYALRQHHLSENRWCWTNIYACLVENERDGIRGRRPKQKHIIIILILILIHIHTSLRSGTWHSFVEWIFDVSLIEFWRGIEWFTQLCEWVKTRPRTHREPLTMNNCSYSPSRRLCVCVCYHVGIKSAS